MTTETMPAPAMPLVLLGGLAMRGAELAPLAAALRARGGEALTFDNLMVGDGPRPAGLLTIAAQAEHAWREVDQHFGAARAVALFGLSMGGMIAATMAASRPERVAQLVLAATSPNLPPLGLAAVPDGVYEAWGTPRTEAELRDVLALPFGRTTRAERPDLVRTYVEYRLARGNGQNGREFLAQLDTVRAFPGAAVYGAVATLGIPVTVMAGDEDRLFAAPHTTYLATELKAGWHCVFSRTGHMLHLEEPVALADALARVVGLSVPLPAATPQRP